MEINVEIAGKFLAALQGDEKLKEWAITALSKFISHESIKAKMWPLVEIWLRNYVTNVQW